MNTMRNYCVAQYLVTISIMSVFATEQNFQTKEGHQLTLVQSRGYASTNNKPYSQTITTPILPILLMPLLTDGILIPIGLAYELKVRKAISIQPNVRFYITKKPYDYLFQVGFNFRWYFIKALNGGYLSPSIDFINMGLTINSVSAAGTSLAVLLKVGYQWILSGFTIDIYLGAGYTYAMASVSSTINTTTSIGYDLGLSMGYAW